jgi:murein DD-endopeptidase MepM/ murein hydrolase activator NlpD
MRRLALVLIASLVAFARLTPAGAETDPVGQWPLRPAPEVVRGFDPPSSPWGAGHRGVDLAGRPAQRVHPALPGTVSFVGSIAGRGVVTVDHGTTRTTYEPVTATVEVGTAVTPRDTVGRLAFPGSHCAPRTCLHWGWIEGETYLDPLRLVGAGPVRLLPLDGLPTPAAAPVPRAERWLLHRPPAWLGALLTGGTPVPP